MAAFDVDPPHASASDDDHLVDRGPHRFLGIPYWLLLIVLTIAAAGLRFTNLDNPSIWGDESATYRRISGTFPETVDSLRTDGFMPTHYLLTWWLKEGMPYWGTFTPATEASIARRERLNDVMRRRGVAEKDLDPPGTTYLDFTPTHRLIEGGLNPTPFDMRFIPALCGTLMVPAIYLLAAQLVARRTALLAAFFTCCSAYMLGYSRDAKMYMQTWFFLTLHVGCFFWWLSAYRRHNPKPLETKRPYEPFPKQRELGAGVAGVLPGQHVGHIARAFIMDAELRDPVREHLAPTYTEPPTRLATLVRWGCWITSGLGMVAFNAIGLAVIGLELLFLLITVPHRFGTFARIGLAIASPVLYVIDRARERSVLRGTGFQPVSTRHGLEAQPTSARRLRDRLNGFCIPPIVGFALGAAACFGLWSSYKDTTRFYDRVLPESTNAAMQVDVNDAGINWVEPYNRGRSAVGLFRTSATAYLFDWEWPKSWHERELDPRALLYLKRTAIGLAIAIAFGLLPWRQAINRFRPNREKRERIARERGPMPATACLLLAAWLLVPAYGFYVAGGAWNPTAQARTRPATEWTEGDVRKVRAVSPFEAIVALDRPVEQPAYNNKQFDDAVPMQGALARELRPVWAGERTWGEAWPRLRALPWGELFTVRPWEGADASPRTVWIVVGIALGIATFAIARWARPTRMLLLVGRAAVVGIVLFALLTVVYVAVPMQNASVWMPRYAGFVWPAFAIGLCVLIRRLPLAPLRWAIVVVLIGVNLTQFVMRCRVGEPPTARMAADFLETRDRPETRLFGTAVDKQFGGPGAGTLNTLPYVYYCSILTREKFGPDRLFGNGGGNYRVPMLNGRNGIRNALRQAPDVTRVTLWMERFPEESADAALDRIRTQLGAGWTLASTDRRMIYDHWTWRRMFSLDRLEWERAGAPTTAPRTVAPR